MRPFYVPFTLFLFLSGFYLVELPKQPTHPQKDIGSGNIDLLNNVYHTPKTLFIEGEYAQTLLKTANGCGIGNFLIPLIGDTSKGVPPRLSSIDLNVGAKILDTLPGHEILGVAFKRMYGLNNTSIINEDASFPYVVITNEGLFSYEIPYDFGFGELDMSDSLFIPDIVMASQQVTTDQSDPIVLVTENAGHWIHYYSYPSLSFEFSFPISYTPILLEVEDNGVYVVGQESNGSHTLYHYSKDVDTLLSTQYLPGAIGNPVELIKSANGYIEILSSPGNSEVVLTHVTPWGSIGQSVVYANGGARATHNEYRGDRFFTFQPMLDTSSANLDEQILILNPTTQVLDTLILNQKLDYFKYPEEHPSAFGNFNLSGFGAKWNFPTNDVFFYGSYGGPWMSQFFAAGRPAFVNATYGCFVNTEDISALEKINFEVYPNPASSYLLLNLTGLDREIPYAYELIDQSGKVLHRNTLYAYQSIELPLHEFAKGVYYFRLQTKDGVVSQKVVIQ